MYIVIVVIIIGFAIRGRVIRGNNLSPSITHTAPNSSGEDDDADDDVDEEDDTVDDNDDDDKNDRSIQSISLYIFLQSNIFIANFVQKYIFKKKNKHGLSLIDLFDKSPPRMYIATAIWA